MFTTIRKDHFLDWSLHWKQRYHGVNQMFIDSQSLGLDIETRVRKFTFNYLNNSYYEEDLITTNIVPYSIT